MPFDLDRLLLQTSRTFALSIPELPEPTRRAIGLAYLLFRIADTFEDATRWSRADRVAALRRFSEILPTLADAPGARVRPPACGATPDSATPDSAASDSATPDFTASSAVGSGGDEDTVSLAALMEGLRSHPPCDHEGYLELLGEIPGVLDETRALDPPTREVLVRHLVRTADGMADYVERGEADGSLRLVDLDDLRRYCYVVAGIVGELISDVFQVHQPSLAAVREAMNANAAAFGEGLQLVNILRDAGDDAREGRVYLPPGADRAAIFAIAREDLRRAGLYIAALQQANAPRGYVSFCALPVLLARATLDRVEQVGTGAKITRDEVKAIVAALQRALDENRPALGD